jgi:hypothetical protein
MRFAEALARTVSITFEYFDEGYSTADAEQLLRLPDQKRVPVDAAAAAVFLQNYLDTANNTSSLKYGWVLGQTRPLFFGWLPRLNGDYSCLSGAILAGITPIFGVSRAEVMLAWDIFTLVKSTRVT